MGLRNLYLLTYNALSAAAWATLLFLVVHGMAHGPSPGTDLAGLAREVQTWAVMEVLHSIFGIVPAPVFTTAVQVYSRLMLVWGISKPFPALNASPWYTSMLAAWALSEIIKYGYFALKLLGVTPYPLQWLRYSAFLVLYPVGISSEVAMMVKAYGPAEKTSPWYATYILLVLIGYIWGSHVMYGHMLKQRKKNLTPPTPPTPKVSKTVTPPRPRRDK